MVNPRAWLAEGLSTYALVFFGPLSIILAIAYFGQGLSTESVFFISIVHGGTIGIMIYAFGHISGAHINPAVTIPMIIFKQMPAKDGAGYVALQVIGAVLAALTLLAIFPELGMKVNLGTQPGPSDVINGSVASAFAVEAILTFFLVLTICMVALHRKAAAGWAGFAIGGMVFLIHMVGIPLTGASVNPARTFGPALVSGAWDHHWLYWAAPILGGIIAVLVIKYIYLNKAESEE